MAETKLTFELGGQVDIRTFANGVDALRQLVTALTPKEAGIAWIVDDLRPGSATITLRGEATRPTDVEKVVVAYNDVGGALSNGRDLTLFNSEVRSAADKIESLARSAEYARFETSYADHVIYGRDEVQRGSARSVGVITGTIQTLSNRSRLTFTIYDSVHDQAVQCYLAPGQEESIRELWGRRARVSGTITRNGVTGLPNSVKDILNIAPIPDAESGGYEQALGVVPWSPGDRMPEDVIREMRDAW